VERCQVVVRADVVVFVDGVPIRFPISVKPYFTKDKANELGAEIGEFKSRIELAKECIKEAMKFFDIDEEDAPFRLRDGLGVKSKSKSKVVLLPLLFSSPNRRDRRGKDSIGR
jgi:hypothetical protein